MTRVWAPLLAMLSVAAGAAIPTPSYAADSVEVHIGAVLASNSGQEFDPRLVALHRQLRTLFPYSSYRLVKEDQKVVAAGGKIGFEIPGGRYLLVMPKALKNERVSMRVMLIQGTRPVVDTVITLRNRATLLVGGPRHKEGVLIISIGAVGTTTAAATADESLDVAPQ
ncbi:MAG: hypothetical protein HYR72_01065 [Deltaproteobacteria bacterium]|nr:hypothetical protein [Deltaproteobacteria bacterium]MBI3391332.1 hypothetical protein [Deltaproteobacteria bacterium]